MTLTEQTLFARRYRLQRRIGRGGFSEVWLAHDERAGQLPLALKIFAPGQGLDAASLQVFAQEYALVFQLNHPGLLRPTHYDEWEDMPYLLMPFLGRGSVWAQLGKVTEHELALLLRDLAGALQYLHSRQPPIVHQDIKPENILRDEDGRYLLADFGISAKLRRTLTRSLASQEAGNSGTLAYMAPERFDRSLEERAPIMANDIFSLGVTLFELLTGELPFGEHGGVAASAGAIPPELPAHFSPALSALLHRCLSSQPWDRPQAADLLAAAEGYLKNHQWGEWRAVEAQPAPPASGSGGRPTVLQTTPGTLNDMVRITGGTFLMGDTFGEGEDDEKPVHTVTLDDFFLGRYAVTFAQYDDFYAATGQSKPDDRDWGRGLRPVINVSWYDAVVYCNWLSIQEGFTPVYVINGDNVTANWAANGYRLPTEAEWEYAARGGGQQVRFGDGRDVADPARINFDASAAYKQAYSIAGEYRQCTLPVGSLNAPNALGLHDMSGNVWEWCWDWYGAYPSGAQTNPRGPGNGSYRLLRGGSWYNNPADVRAAYRSNDSPGDQDSDLGFRLARSAR